MVVGDIWKNEPWCRFDAWPMRQPPRPSDTAQVSSGKVILVFFFVKVDYGFSCSLRALHRFLDMKVSDDSTSITWG